MRRSFSFLVAAALTAALSAESFVPAQAAAPRPAPIATGSTSGAIVQVGGNWENFHGDRHNSFRDDGWNRHHRRHRRNRHHGNFFPNQFYFGFPFAFVQPYQRYHRRQDCFRTWEGYVVCR